MAYNFPIPKDMLGDLYLLREYFAGGSIASQIRSAVKDYIETQERKIGSSGSSISDVAEAIKLHNKEVSN
ncbi:MAG: hypothetical protein PHG83_02480 [Patescibacteria group bacterium]|nr:hypothetical protein [Patescibacteria group bacterium]